jgi:hypothetical protein
MSQPIIENSYLVEIPIGTPAAQKRLNFQFVPQLEGAQIYGIASFSASQFGTSPNGLAVASAAGLASCTVTFSVGDDEKVYIYPLADLNALNTAGFIRVFNNLKINLTKSYITLQAVTGLVANDAILLNFIYRNK